MASPPPAAPTPPSGMGIQSADRTSTLLSLLKFSGAGASHASTLPSSGGQQQQSRSNSNSSGQHPPPPQQPPQPSSLRDSSIEYPTTSVPPRILQPVPAAADPTGILAALMRGHHEPEEQPPPMPEPPMPPPPQTSYGATSPTNETRQMLLNILNRPKPSQSEQPPALLAESKPPNMTPPLEYNGDTLRSIPQLQQALSGANTMSSMAHMPPSSYSFDRSYEQTPTYSFPSTHSTQEGSMTASNIFSFNSPYDTLSHSSETQTPNAGSVMETFGSGQSTAMSHHTSGIAPYQILKKPLSSSSTQSALDHLRHGSEHSPNSSSGQVRRKFEHSSSPNAGPTPGTTESYDSYGMVDKPKESVSEAITEVAEQADREAQEALARREQDSVQVEIANDLQDMLRAETDQEFHESAHHAAQNIQRELDREENFGVLEQTLPPHLAQEVRQIVDDAAAPDSWESADQDEIVVIEEDTRPPVRVFNFPMKPWISITLQENATEPRPFFTDKSAVNIAKLKKDFDQIDRNLYTASENYMVYGMPKVAGGLRVIRQDDGRDARIFTDTKDRIFNVSMSVTPSDPADLPREAIIGTGISGTVYWVLVREGESDHLDEPHPEQYGFALPPISAQEGDAPGGVLKTRARPSTIHPEFFAVGRGKSINIVWPAYIMSQPRLFKPGPDRVVDADQLAQECSLKINTGKAGKDFTFSQDDTVIVSLDKSGRVKFWDVRELTAVKEGSDPRYPYPAQTALELKEPIMTLNSTPEGEKAWPTSVLLLDKQRPYQKRCALRYMIVGMKQNHTLQLWDLALGKPVQEFNLPHSKESDAVCSVMYHPQTGMLVIGHPTRNSIYFAHLSAPKYNLKSVSQVEYIQRLAAQDSSMPPPDSTAVISGVREYSLDNKGTLRSLDILCSPANTQDDSVEPALFELYAMHSKGVACLSVRQAELGWSSENKVMDGVDAVDAGVAVITNLKSPAPLPVTGDSIHLGDESSQMRLATRPFSKEPVLQSTPPQDDGLRSRIPEAHPTALKLAKDEDLPGANTHGAAERSEKKGRKKGNKGSAPEPSPNGSNNSPRATPSAAKSGDSAKQLPNAAPSINQESMESLLRDMELRLGSNLGGVVETSVKSLVNHVNDSMQARDEDFDARQLKLLEMVSSVLNENTQGVLGALIQEQFSESVIPTISQVASKAVSDQLKNNLTNQLSPTIQKEIQKALPAATHSAMHNTDFVKAISDRVAGAVAGNVQQEMSSLISRITPVVTNVALQGCQRFAEEQQQVHREEFDRLHAQRMSDTNKIDQLLSLITRLSDTVSTMAAAQSQFQGEFLKFQQQAMRDRQSVPEYPMAIQAQVPSMGTELPSPHRSMNQVTPNRGPQIHGQGPSLHAVSSRPPLQPNMSSDNEGNAAAKVIQQMEMSLRNGKYDEAILLWIQSGLEGEIFVTFLHKLNPIFIRELSPLMLLSMAASLAMQLDSLHMIREKITWLEMAIHNFHAVLNAMDDQTREVTPRIMSVVVERTENIMLRISGANPSDPILKNLSQMVILAKRSLDAARGPSVPRYD